MAFSTGGVFFLIFGLILFFDRALLAMGNILFLIGITLLLGPQRTFVFFARRQKWRGSAAFWAGVTLILLRWTFVGFLVECVGIFYLFGEYVPTPSCLGFERGGSEEYVWLIGGAIQVLQDNGWLRVQYPRCGTIPRARAAGCRRQGGRK